MHEHPPEQAYCYGEQGPRADEPLLVYSAMMRGLLALPYVPPYVAWQTKARRLRHMLCPWPSAGVPGHDWYVILADLEGLLNLKVNPGAAFTTGLGILAPFVSILITAVGMPPPK